MPLESAQDLRTQFVILEEAAKLDASGIYIHVSLDPRLKRG